MKIAVLGSTGYLGSRLVKSLANINGNDILCLKLYEDKACSLNEVKEKVKICNIRDVNKIKEHYDCLINCCCKYEKNGVTVEEILNANYCTPKSIFEIFNKLGISKHITIDTSLPRNVNIYSQSKGYYSNYLQEFSKSNNYLNIINIKLENYYGKNEPINRFIPNTIIKLLRNEDIELTDGKQKRDFVYIDDVIDNIIKLIYMDNLPNYIDLPIGTGEDVSIKELVEYLKEVTDSSSQLLFGAIKKRTNEPNTKADISLMNKYDLKCNYSWKEGLLKLL